MSIPNAPKTTKRDTLIDIELKYQSIWENDQQFQIDAGTKDEPKFYVTFPFLYANGRPHLGHAFSMTKAEFAVGFQAMLGKRALFPMGFHVTGMPIKASADKLKREIEMFGTDFVVPAVETQENEPPETGIKKKAKINLKSGGAKYQFQIMQNLGIPKSEIAKFADPEEWIRYFPPKMMADLKQGGFHIDWRRAFCSTKVNPYFDSFVGWQMRKLKKLAKVKFGERFTIWSPKDGQACMDHDRASGEGVGPQEYTGIKLAWDRGHSDAPTFSSYIDSNERLKGRNIYLVAATLRPETMYGQTNCYVSRKLMYGFFDIDGKDVFVCSDRAANNMAHQGFSPQKRIVSKLGEISGKDIIGAAVRAPLARYDFVYVLPMDSILPGKGTTVVTSVPSDSPADWIMLNDFRKKPQYYEVKNKWINGFEPMALVRTPTLGDIAAETAIKKLKIASPNDKAKLEEAKEMVYKEGFHQGTMLVGDYVGDPVSTAKPKVKEQMIENGQAFVYCEPERQIMSRSGDECVVCLTDQWYLDYGDESWKAQTKKCLERMNTFHPEARRAYEATLDWLHEWACARQFGLGTDLPWDPQYLVESLSDSTIYMAYYTIAHMLHNDIYGQDVGAAGIKAEELTDDVWEYIFIEGANKPTGTTISDKTFAALHKEFQYFYPMDLRSSGKDLIQNHLPFALFNHVAIFPEKHWPRAYRVNGHLMMNSEKMSKQTGNFLTLSGAVEQYGADATRIALADAGDTMEDANFVEAFANAQILRLFTQKEWMETISQDSTLRTGGDYTFNDRVFDNAMSNQIKLCRRAYENCEFRDALKNALFDLQDCRDWYRDATQITGESMRKDLVQRFIEVQALLLAPIAPHWCDYIWREVLGNRTCVRSAAFPDPAATPVDVTLVEANDYVRRVIHAIRTAEASEAKKRKKKKAANGTNETGPKKLVVIACKGYMPWQKQVVDTVKSSYDSLNRIWNGGEIQTLAKAKIGNKKAIPFLQILKDHIEKIGDAAFERGVSFDELETLRINENLICQSVGYKTWDLLVADDVIGDKEKYGEALAKKAEGATPGYPVCTIETA